MRAASQVPTGAEAPVVAAALLVANGAVGPVLGGMGRVAMGACPACMGAWAGVPPAAATTGAAARVVLAPTEEPVIARLEVCRPAGCVYTYVLLFLKAQWGGLHCPACPQCKIDTCRSNGTGMTCNS